MGEDIKVDVYPIQQAIKLAQDQGLDLVEISPNADPPVCKIVDYSKIKYEQKKKQKEIKSKALKVVLKEIRFGPNTDEHDFNFKLKKVRMGGRTVMVFRPKSSRPPPRNHLVEGS